MLYGIEERRVLDGMALGEGVLIKGPEYQESLMVKHWTSEATEDVYL